jgi:hypothetical protein
VNVLYFLYFGDLELVYHFERVWTDDGMRYTDDEYSYIFCGLGRRDFPVDLETYCFLYENEIVEQTSGNEHDRIFKLTSESRCALEIALAKNFAKRKYGEYFKTIA